MQNQLDLYFKFGRTAAIVWSMVKRTTI